MAWHDTASAVADLVTAGALLVGGSWGYFRFVRGRVFAPRAELAVAAAPLRPPLSGLRVQVALRNTGASRVSVSLRFVEIFAVSEIDWPIDTNVDWGEPVLSTRIFQFHDWVESAETITEDVLAPLRPGAGAVAWLVRAHVHAVKHRWGRLPTGWTAQTVVLRDGIDAPGVVSAQIPD